MKNFKYFIFLFGIVLITAFSCKKNDTTDNHPNPLLFREWILSSIQDTKTKQIIPYPDNLSHKESITFTDSLIMNFSGICNVGRAKYSANNNSIQIKDLYTTLFYCSDWELYLTNNLDSAFQYNVTASQLEIYSKGTYNLIFIPIASK